MFIDSDYMETGIEFDAVFYTNERDIYPMEFIIILN